MNGTRIVRPSKSDDPTSLRLETYFQTLLGIKDDDVAIRNVLREVDGPEEWLGEAAM